MGPIAGLNSLHALRIGKGNSTPSGPKWGFLKHGVRFVRPGIHAYATLLGPIIFGALRKSFWDAWDCGLMRKCADGPPPTDFTLQT